MPSQTQREGLEGRRADRTRRLEHRGSLSGITERGRQLLGERRDLADLVTGADVPQPRPRCSGITLSYWPGIRDKALAVSLRLSLVFLESWYCCNQD